MRRPWTSPSSHSCRYSVCVGTMPQGENHNLVIPNHSGSHAKIEPIPFFVVVLTVLPVIKGNVCYVRVWVCVHACVGVCIVHRCYCKAHFANSTFETNWVRKCPGPVNVRRKTNVRSKILGLQRRSLKWCGREVGSTIPLALLFSHLKGAGLAGEGYHLPSPLPWQNHAQRCQKEMLRWLLSEAEREGTGCEKQG